MPTPSQIPPLSAGLPVTRARSTRRLALASPETAALLGLLVLLLLVATVPLGNLSRQPINADNASSLLVFVPFAIVGFVVARRQPQNPIGWIVLGVAMFFLLSDAAGGYAAWDYRFHNGQLPLGVVAVFLQLGWAPAILLLPLPVFLFPDGQLPSRRWRWVMGAYLAISAVWFAANLGVAASGVIGQHIKVDTSGQLTVLDHPAGLAALVYTWANSLLLVFVVFWLLWVVRLVATYLRSTGERRQQLKWFMAGAAMAGVCLTLLLTAFGSSTGSQSTLFQVVGFLVTFGLAALPVGLGVAILKYRLYDIDRLISRTLSYAIVTGLLIGVYVGLVTVATRVLPFSSPLGVAASTLVAAALFTPLRRMVQRLVDRRFNRARYDAEATIEAFAHRLREDVDLEAVSSEFVRAVQASVEPSHVSLWLRSNSSSS
jgi:hypothetical protein